MTEKTLLKGRYELREQIGTGGMSRVFKGWDVQEQRIVAVKVLKPEYSHGEEARWRFRNEVEAASQMHHPNIVQIYDHGEDGDMCYIVMEYAEGITLKEYIRRNGRLRPQTAVRIGLGLLAAVNHAHGNHVIHRDIKPANVIIGRRHSLKVADFGIAQTTDADVPEDRSGEDFASVHYFSPEQAAGRPAVEQSDLYSVGVVLYEMLTGHVPFSGEDQTEIARKHMEEAPATAGISQGMDEVLAHALEKDPANRYASAAEMARDLKRALKRPEGGFIGKSDEELAAGEEAIRRRIRRKQIEIALCLGCCALLAAGSLILFNVLYRSMSNRGKVPEVRQMDLEDAVILLEENEIRYTIVEDQEAMLPAGIITAQSLEAGTVLDEEETLEIRVSTGQNVRYVPTLTGLSLAEAEEKLIGQGFVLGPVEPVYSDEVQDTVLGQTPQTGEYATTGTEIALVVSGPKTSVPKCTGMLLEDARQLLELNGLRVGSTEHVSGDMAQDTVLSQSVPEGEMCLIGESVDLTVCDLIKVHAYTAKIELRFTLNADENHVIIKMSDGDGELTVYEETLEKGAQTVPLELLSREAGLHTVTLYCDETVLAEKSVLFR